MAHDEPTSEASELQAPPPALPMHPRARHHVFTELLGWRRELTPALADTALPTRVQRLQERYLRGVYTAKRGSDCFRAAAPTDSSQRVTLRLSTDGAQLQVAGAGGGDVALVRLHEIRGISVSSTQAFGFSLRVTSANEEERAVALVASSPAELMQWVLVLTCGANAFQWSQDGGDPLVWQAARLRIFELADVLPLPEAVRAVGDGVRCLLRTAGAGGSAALEPSSNDHGAQLFLTCT